MWGCTVFASFIASVHRIDAEKKANLTQVLTDGVVSTMPGEKLDDKLKAMTFDGQQLRTDECPSRLSVVELGC
jgi:hypothetical protein